MPSLWVGRESAMNTSQSECPGMIVSRIEALGFRSLRYVSQDLEPFHVLVGPNASGKSTFLDVLAFLVDLQHVGLEHAVTGNISLDVPLRAVDPRHLTWMRRGAAFELAVEARIPRVFCEHLRRKTTTVCRYEIKVDVSGPLRIAEETLWLKPEDNSRTNRQRIEFPSPPEPPERIIILPEKRAPAGWRRVMFRESVLGRVMFRSETSRSMNRFQITGDKSALTVLPPDEENFPVATWFRHMLTAGIQRIALSSEAMHLPCSPSTSNAYLSDGWNLPQIIQKMEIERPDRYADWMKHVREALPEIERITVTKRPEDGYSYLVTHYRNGLLAPSWLVSDGTLRFLALTLLAYIPNPTGPYLIEEPENGIHPRAVETVMQSLSAVYDAQILLATHSSLVARLAEADQLLCFACDRERGTDVVTGPAHPRLKNPRGVMDLGLLHASGVLG